MFCESVQRCGCEFVLCLPGQQRVWWVGVHLHMRRWLRTVWQWCQSFVHGVLGWFVQQRWRRMHRVPRRQRQHHLGGDVVHTVCCWSRPTFGWSDILQRLQRWSV
jgi:hypothetical protein